MMGETILVVDDEAAIADLVEVYLKNEGYEICKFGNAKEALDCVERERISLAALLFSFLLLMEMEWAEAAFVFLIGTLAVWFFVNLTSLSGIWTR